MAERVWGLALEALKSPFPALILWWQKELPAWAGGFCNSPASQRPRAPLQCEKAVFPGVALGSSSLGRAQTAAHIGLSGA